MPDGSIGPPEWPIETPWTNGFEDGFCGYAHARGYCYHADKAEYALVEAPVHSGARAARFSVTASDPDGKETRCVREGELPEDATYGAWYFLPETVQVATNWNLMLFQAKGADNGFHKLWDVTIGFDASNRLRLHIFDQQRPDDVPALSDDHPVLVPIGSWFHIAFHWKRESDATGVVELYQGDAGGDTLIQAATNIQTDVKGSPWGQWYVGNLVDQQTPADSTVYVDDVSIRPNH